LGGENLGNYPILMLKLFWGGKIIFWARLKIELPNFVLRRHFSLGRRKTGWPLGCEKKKTKAMEKKKVVCFVRGKIRRRLGCVPWEGKNQIAIELLKINVKEKKRRGCVTWVEYNWAATQWCSLGRGK
jgi:hypothetical protein